MPSNYPRLVYLDQMKIDISGPKGNAYSILGIAQRCLRKCGINQTTIDEFLKEAMSGDYKHLCETVTAATGIQLRNGRKSSNWL